MFSRRHLLAGVTALGGASFLPTIAHAKGSVAAAIYPGSWRKPYRAIVASGAEKEGQRRPRACSRSSPSTRSRRPRPHAGRPRSTPSCSIRVRASPRSRTASSTNSRRQKITNASKLPAGLVDEGGVGVNAQVVGIAYNPKKVPAPKGWNDLLTDPWVSRLGLTGFQTTFGTAVADRDRQGVRRLETNIEPALVELKKVLSKVARSASRPPCRACSSKASAT